MTNSIFIGEPSGPLNPNASQHVFGYKVVIIRWNEGNPVLVPPHYYFNETKFSDESHCRTKHDSPESFQNCTCGFYSYHTVEGAKNHLANFGYAANCCIAQVSLGGTIINATNGMKSTRQRIRQLVVPPCWNCYGASSCFVKHKAGYLVGACTSCVNDKKLSPITFDEFQRVTQIPEFNPISLLPVSEYSMKTLNQAFDYADAKRMIAEGIRELVAANELSPLIALKFDVDEIVAKLMADEK